MIQLSNPNLNTVNYEVQSYSHLKNELETPQKKKNYYNTIKSRKTNV